MILVLLGTQNNSFHRLLEEIDNLITKKIITDTIIVQAGYTKYEPKNENMKIFDFVSKDDLEKYQDEADLIITHGGVRFYNYIFGKRQKSNCSCKKPWIWRTC